MRLQAVGSLQETYFKAVASAPIVVAEGEEELEVDYDSDGNPIMPERAKVSGRGLGQKAGARHFYQPRWLGQCLISLL